MNMNGFKANVKLEHDFINKKISILLDGKKIKIAIKNKKNTINNLYVELGKITYNKKNNSENYDRTVQDVCKHIKFEKESIKKLIRQLEFVSDIDQNKKSIDFNESKTVEKFKIPDCAPEPLINSEGLSLYKFCPECQIGNNPEEKNCIYCGEKFNK